MSTHRLVFGLGVLPVAAILTLAGSIFAPSAFATVSCPNSNPIVNENNCMGAGSSAWQIGNGRSYDLSGFATQTSYNLGQSVTLKIAGYAKTVDISVFRMGYYGGKGGRLVASAEEVPVNNGFGCEPMNKTTGEVNCENWEPTYTVPASKLTTTGVYLAKIVDPEGDDNQIIFIVREDSPSPGSEILVKIPTSTYQAYNWWGGKSLYNYNSSPPNLANGYPRAFSVSFARPFQDIATGSDENWFLKADYAMVYWLEKEGYNVSYTDGVAIDEKPELLLNHKIFLVSGHDEYWSGKELAAVKNAREHGVNIAAFSGNTAYWKVQYEDNHRRMTDYKTVADGSSGINDPGPESPTTTFRDPGEPAGSPNAPPGGRPGPDTPENSIFGVMYVGDTLTNTSYGLTVPPADGAKQYAGDSIWRNTGINPETGATIGTNVVGWEWEGVPSQPGYLKFQPPGVIQVSRTFVEFPGSTEWIEDYGREFGSTPPAGQPPYTESVKYRAASGALVFSAGTIQWSWGLGPHFQNQSTEGFNDPPTESSDKRIQQATYNIFSEMGVQPQTPTGIVLDGTEGPPTADFATEPSVVHANQSITFNASGSYGIDGAKIVDYKWDFNGDGTYETDAGSSPSITHTFTSTGSVTVGLQVTDSNGRTATTTRTITVEGSPSGPYAEAVMNTPGLLHYWRLDESSGSQFADVVGGNTATILGSVGSVTLGQSGALVNDLDTAAAFDGVSGAAQAPVNLSSTSKLTIEFWLKWNKYENNDSLAMELTPNFNEHPGGFLVDPNASDLGGTFAVGLGINGSRNNVFFARPSAGVWHYYAFVLDSTAAGASQITPYVDGKLVTYTKIESGTGAGPFANSTLSFMSRNAERLFGAGTLDEVALYGQTLTSETIRSHYEIGSGNSAAPTPTASFTTEPSTVHANQSIAFNASSSSGANGAKIVDYKWDFDGNGTYETDAGSSPTITHTFTAAGSVTVGLQVTDSNGLTATTTRTIAVEGALSGPYPEAVLATPGLLHYWRLDESSGPALADMVGGDAATIFGSPGSVILGQPGALVTDSDTAAAFDGVSGAAQAPVNLSSTSKLTIEFWLKWNKYENNDSLAMELTPNFNEHPGGFLVDPNASDLGGTFGVGLGINGSRNNVFFARPSAGVWHYYAFALDTTAAGSSEITPYVDGRPIPYTKTESHTEAGPFANSTLNFMSRNASTLFGSGTLDEVALYGQALSAETILSHYQTGSGSAGPLPTASFAVSPATVHVNQSVTLDASGSSGANGAAIVDYKWDLDGNGTYETDAGSTPKITHTFTTAGSVTVGLQVTDSNGLTATTTRTIKVEPPITYTEAIESTAGLVHYWRLDELSGSTLADAVGGSTASILGEPGAVTLGQAGAIASESDTAAAFNGITGAAQAPVNLSSTSKLTIEFWLKWNKYENNDALAMELTPNFGEHPGGFLVDPSAPEEGGKFAVAIGEGAARNSVFFARPSAGVWHYYAFAINSEAPATGQITPYVDGKAVAYTKLASGTGAGPFANSTLNFMSRNASTLFGAGTLDELALYNTMLNAETILEHYELAVGSSTGAEIVVKDTTSPTTPVLSFGGLSSTTSYSASSNSLYFNPARSGAFTVSAVSSDPDTGIASYTFSPLTPYGFTEKQEGGTNSYTFGEGAKTPLTPPTVFATNGAGLVSAPASYNLLSDSSAPTGGALIVNGTVATATGSSSVNKSGKFTISLRTDYSLDVGSGVASSALTRASAPLTRAGCGKWGSEVVIAGSPEQRGVLGNCYRYTLTGTDRVGNSAAIWTVVKEG